MSGLPSTAPWLVVGSSGRVGRMARRAWQAEGASPLAYQGRRNGQGDLTWDLEDGSAALRLWVEVHGVPDVLIMLAGVTPGPGVDLSMNARLAEACLAAAAEVGCSRVLVASSSAVYGAGRGEPLAEEDPLRPVNEYGRAKVAMEEVCHAWAGRGLDVCAMRIGNVAGADALLLNAARASREQPLQLDRFANGAGPLRSYIGPRCFAQVLQSLGAAPSLPAVVNVAAPGPVSMEALLVAADVPWQWRPAPTKALQHITLDGARLAGLHAFQPRDSEAATMIDEWTNLRDPR